MSILQPGGLPPAPAWLNQMTGAVPGQMESVGGGPGSGFYAGYDATPLEVAMGQSGGQPGGAQNFLPPQQSFSSMLPGGAAQMREQMAMRQGGLTQQPNGQPFTDFGFGSNPNPSTLGSAGGSSPGQPMQGSSPSSSQLSGQYQPSIAGFTPPQPSTSSSPFQNYLPPMSSAQGQGIASGSPSSMSGSPLQQQMTPFSGMPGSQFSGMGGGPLRGANAGFFGLPALYQPSQAPNRVTSSMGSPSWNNLGAAGGGTPGQSFLNQVTSRAPTPTIFPSLTPQQLQSMQGQNTGNIAGTNIDVNAFRDANAQTLPNGQLETNPVWNNQGPANTFGGVSRQPFQSTVINPSAPVQYSTTTSGGQQALGGFGPLKFTAPTPMSGTAQPGATMPQINYAANARSLAGMKLY